tara:strand:- start:55996 stop:56904 length:909 start_codon:yes stop_codon:yes gene_type:complete
MALKNVLVTGAAGLIGNATLKLLIQNNYNVIGLDFNDIDATLNIPFLKINLSDFDPSDLEEFNITSIVHCAAHPGGKSLQEPELDVEINALASIKLFNWAALNNKEVIYLSSSAVYGDHPDAPTKEDGPTDPGTIYAICKVACERFLKTLNEAHGLKYTVLRLFATYGAGHKPNKFQGIVNIMKTQLIEGNNVIIKGSPLRVRGMLYVDDAASAILRTLELESARGQIINISHPEPTTIKNIIIELCKVLGINFEDIKIIEEQGTIGDTFYNYACTKKMETILNFNPTYNLRSGLTKLISYK